jgi:glycosyltransferase involved in cell wall biosynthesis
LIYLTIPAHNEGRTLGVLLWKLRKVMADFGRDYRILVLDDASTDRTPEVLERYASVVPLTAIRSDERLGYGQALERLIRTAVDTAPYPKRDVVVTLQGDFTEDADALVTLVKAVEGGADLVAGTLDEEEEPPPRTIRLFRRIAHLLMGRTAREAPVPDPVSGFRAYRVVVLRKALRELAEGEPLLTGDGWDVNVELLRRAAPHARRIEEAPYRGRFRHRPRPSRLRPFATLRGLLALRGKGWTPGEGRA